MGSLIYAQCKKVAYPTIVDVADSEGLLEDIKYTVDYDCQSVILQVNRPLEPTALTILSPIQKNILEIQRLMAQRNMVVKFSYGIGNALAITIVQR